MSIKLMTLAWESAIPSTEKMVLLCLCDFANDDGASCHPSIATIAKKTSKNERTVQRAIRWLEDNKILTSYERKGTSTNYQIHPRHIVTPDKLSPLTNETKGGGVVSPQGWRGVTQTTNEPPMEPPTNNKRAKACAKPIGISDDLWSDWLSHRDGKFSQTALAGFEREAAKAGWSVAEAFTEAIERKWQGFKADWVKDKQNGNHGRNQDDGMGRTERAAIRALNDLGLAPSQMGGCQPTRPAMPVPRIYADRGAQSNALLSIGHDRE